jgi:hypothetical protein
LEIYTSINSIDVGFSYKQKLEKRPCTFFMYYSHQYHPRSLVIYSEIVTFLIVSVFSIPLVLTKPAFHVQDQEKLVENRGRKDKRMSNSCIQVEFFPGVLHCADPEKFCNNKIVNNDKGIEIEVEMWEYDFGTSDEQAKYVFLIFDLFKISIYI